MEDRSFETNQGGPGQGGTSKPGGKVPGNDGQHDRGIRQPDKPAARPTPSGVPNEADAGADQNRNGGKVTPVQNPE